MREMIRLVLFVLVLGTDNSSYSFSKHENKKNQKKVKKSLTHTGFLL
jgi:hypothetical protein